MLWWMWTRNSNSSRTQKSEIEFEKTSQTYKCLSMRSHLKIARTCSSRNGLTMTMFRSFWVTSKRCGWITNHCGTIYEASKGFAIIFMFEGCAPDTPSTNNATEATNNTIKKEGICHECLPLGHFLTIVSRIVSQWSILRRDGEEKEFAKKPKITLKTCTLARQMLQVKRKMVSSDDTSYPYYSQAQGVSEDDFRSSLSDSLQASSFDEVIKHWLQHWKIEANGRCSCPVGIKKYMCKHITAVLAIRSELSTPDMTKTVPIGATRKWGQPAKAKKVLLKQ